MEISAKDQKIRLSWLRLTAGLLIGLQIIELIFPSDISTAEILFSLFRCILGLCFFYYFTYRKFGLRWLLINIIVLSLGCLMIIIKEGFDYPQAITILLSLYWIYQSVRVFRFNKRFQLATIRSSKGYLEAMPIFESISSFDELDTTFGKHLFAHAHSSPLEEGIIKAYKDRKKILKSEFNKLF